MTKLDKLDTTWANKKVHFGGLANWKWDKEQLQLGMHGKLRSGCVNTRP